MLHMQRPIVARSISHTGHIMTTYYPSDRSVSEAPHAGHDEHAGPRIVIDEETGSPCVASRPGARKITAEDVKKMLEDFP
jgi:hypothetical protein